jgi:hypothetical protein
MRRNRGGLPKWATRPREGLRPEGTGVTRDGQAGENAPKPRIAPQRVIGRQRRKYHRDALAFGGRSGTDRWPQEQAQPRRRKLKAAACANKQSSFFLPFVSVRAETYRCPCKLGNGGTTMCHFSVLLISPQGAFNLKRDHQPFGAVAATLKTATPAKARLMRGIATAAILLLTIPPITDAAEARPGGGGGRGGGFGGHVGVSAPGFAGRGGGLGFAGRPVGGARIGGRGIGDRSLGASHFSGRSFTAPRAGVATARFSANHLARTRVAGPGRGAGESVFQ